MKRNWTAWAVVICGFLFTLSGIAGTWRTFDGQVIHADPVEFDFETKMVTLENPDTQARANYNTRDLDFASRRLLLFSPIFHSSLPSGLPSEKLWLFGLAMVSPILLLIVGMWVSGLFIARKFNPFSAVGAFLGSWIAGVILMICYLIFAEKGGFGIQMVGVGGIVGVAAMALFISAIYQTSYLKGVLIFVGHLVFAGFFAYILLYHMDKFMSPDDVSAFWQKWVFSPTGLVDGPPRDGY